MVLKTKTVVYGHFSVVFHKLPDYIDLMKSLLRQKEVIERIPYNGYVLVKDLSRMFGVTEETIRRDLQKISDSDPSIRKVHGGVYRVAGDDSSVPQELRKVLLTEEKTRFADYVASFITAEDTVMMDSSTTVLFVARALRKLDITPLIITNSIQIAQLFTDDEKANVILLGGRLRKRNGSLTGEFTLSMAERYCADYALISPTYIDPVFGVTDDSEEEAAVRKAMMDSSKKSILIADHTKFGNTTRNRICGIGSFEEVVTDRETPGEWVKAFEAKKIPVIVC